MNYVDRYIYAVVKYLPEKDRTEISEELRANIFDMLGNDTSEENIIRILEEMGSPFKLALSYMGSEHYIIGPKVYHLYLEVLKIVAIAAVIIGIITFTLELITEVGGIASVAEIIGVIVSGFTTIFSVLIGFVFWVTVIFVIIERTDSADEVLHSIEKPFKVSNLKEIPNMARKKISKFEMVVTMVMTIVFIYIFVYRNDLIAVYTQNDTIRIFNGDVIAGYKFIILFSGGLSILVSILKLIYGRWNELLGISTAVDSLVNLGVTVLVLTNRDLLSRNFIIFLEEVIEKTGTDVVMNIDLLRNGVIAFICIVTLFEIGAGLYYGFVNVKTKMK